MKNKKIFKKNMNIYFQSVFSIKYTQQMQAIQFNG